MDWYALQSKSRKEDALFQQLRSQGFEIYYPRILVQPANPRSHKIKPYFPGYLFVRVNLAVIGPSTFNWMPFAAGLVSFGDEPATVSEDLIAAIRERVDAVNQAGGEVFHRIKPGDSVRIHHGPFAGYEAIFDARLKGSDRVRVLLTLLNNREVPIELDVGRIRVE
jgi:transcription antitermination factor NusG